MSIYRYIVRELLGHQVNPTIGQRIKEHCQKEETGTKIHMSSDPGSGHLIQDGIASSGQSYTLSCDLENFKKSNPKCEVL